MLARFPGSRAARGGTMFAFMAATFWAAAGCDSNPNGPAAPPRPSSPTETVAPRSESVKDILKGKPQPQNTAQGRRSRRPRKTFDKAGKSNMTVHGLD